MKYYRTK